MYLKYNDEKGFPREYELKNQTVVIGRGKGVDIQFIDELLSRRHCEVRLVEGRYVLTDLGSKNGTKVNNSPVETIMLNPGDLIRIGDIYIRFVEHLEISTTTALNEIREEMEQGHGYKTIMRKILTEADRPRPASGKDKPDSP